MSVTVAINQVLDLRASTQIFNVQIVGKAAKRVDHRQPVGMTIGYRRLKRSVYVF